MKKRKLVAWLALALCSSLVCIASLRPSDAVETTAGRASSATVESTLRADMYSLQGSRVYIFDSFEKELQLQVRLRATTTTTLPPTTTTVPPTTVPPTTVPPAPSNVQQGEGRWDALCGCETGYTYDWATNTGNGYYGGLQFAYSTWIDYGGGEFAPYAHQASREQQIIIAERVLAEQGWEAWPACSRKLGYR